MAHAQIQSVEYASAPAHRPLENEKRPWAVDYCNGVRSNGDFAARGTVYFTGSAEAEAWRRVVLEGVDDAPIAEKAVTPDSWPGWCFSAALRALKAGACVARTGWNGKGLWIELQQPDANSKMTLPYLFINYPADAANTPGARVPWLASQTDLLAEDWYVVR